MRVGIDTGGTFTDASLLNDEGEVVACAKAPTTHDDLIVGVSAALHQILDAAAAAGIDQD
ncbi:MAG: hydantoinase/oxoprolinase N-terminal domain-containing protein, partial [Acidimicrobiia bacterium]